jgi:hypothetical protein
MSTVKSQQELYDEFIQELQSQSQGELSDENDGSINDVLAGVVSFAVSELSRLTIDEFRKTFFDTANGPEVTGGPDDLETLAVDHFGENFARPAATAATGTVTFSRPNTDAGNVIIPAGTIVKTAPNANGQSQRFETEAQVTLVTTSISATVNAIVAGEDGNVLANTITLIESALTDSSVTVDNGSNFSGGAPEQNDVDYRETIRNRLTTLTGATLVAIIAGAKTVPGVETATAIENEMVVIEFDISTDLPKVGAEYFRIPQVVLYIADVNGTADSALIQNTYEALQSIRAAGVRIDIAGAVALSLNWTAGITLNPGGPNYTELSSDPSPIADSMEDYIRDLPIGDDFIKDDADAAILAIWGPAGTNDLVDFVTTIPSGNVPAAANEKLIPGTVEIA